MTDTSKDVFEVAFNEAIKATQDAGADTAPDQPEVQEESQREEEQVSDSEQAEQEHDSDPWATATEEQRAAYQDLLDRLDRSEHSAKSNSGRVSALQKQINELQTQIEAANKAATEKSEESNKESFSGFEEDFPDIADYYKKQTDSRINEVQKGFATQLESTTQQIRGELYKTTLDAVRPGWEEVANSKEFSDWLFTQDNDIQAAAGQLNPGAALRVLNAYDTHKKSVSEKAKTIQQSREQRLKASTTIPNAGKPAHAEDMDDFDSAFEAAIKQRLNKRIW